MAPTKTILTVDALDEHTALELPERELMCGCGSLLNINLGVTASANLGGISAGACATAGTSGINAGVAVAVTTSSYGCGS